MKMACIDGIDKPKEEIDRVKMEEAKDLVEKLVARLNVAMELDPEGMNKLIKTRIGVLNGLVQSVGFTIFNDYDAETETFREFHYATNEDYFRRGPK